MKKFLTLLFACLILCFSAYDSLGAGPKKDQASSMTTEQNVRLQLITKRVMEIKHTDKSRLSRDDRKSLRIELRQLRKEAADMAPGGVFLTVGALLAVIVLLILLL